MLSILDIYGYGKPLRKSTSYVPMMQGNDGYSTPTCIDKVMHRMMRERLNEGLSSKHMRHAQGIIGRKADVFIEVLLQQNPDLNTYADEWTKPKDVNHLCKTNAVIIYINSSRFLTDLNQGKYLAFDCISEFGFGQDLNLLGSSANRYLVDIFEWCTFRIGAYEHWPSLAKMKLELVLGILRTTRTAFRAFLRWRQGFLEFLSTSVKHGEMLGAFSHLALQSKEIDRKGREREPYSMSRIAAETTTLLIVGKSRPPQARTLESSDGNSRWRYQCCSIVLSFLLPLAIS